MTTIPVIFPATLELSTLNGIIGTAFNGVSPSDNSGWSVASVGDMNGDGLSDIVIGADTASPAGRTSAGSSFVVFGTRAGFGSAMELFSLNGINGFRINGILTGDLSGYSVASAGDMNGDGLSDLIIGAYAASPGNRTKAGSSFVVFGTRMGFGATLELSSLNGTNGFRINGVSAGDWSGYSVANAGDINDDSFSDIIIGARGTAPGGRSNAGSSFVVFGKNTSYSSVLELSTLNSSDGFWINGVSAGDFSGTSVASAGDINGDGLNDIVIGATQASPDGRSQAGSSFIVFGTRAGFGVVLELSTLNGTNGFRINGVSSSDQSGISVASAGDMNGDGLSDLAIGAFTASPDGQNIAGSSFIVFGTRAGFGAVLELSTLNGTNGFRINGAAAGDTSGFSLASAGDINGDSLSDLIIGAYAAAPGGRVIAGSSFVVFGTRASFGATMELSSLSGRNGFRINGISSNDFSGYSVASAGDMNGDGLSDLIIGALGATVPGNRAHAGASFLVFGDNIQITVNQQTILGGGSQVLTPLILNSSASGDPKYVKYTVTEIQHGYFVDIAQPHTPITIFSGQDVLLGRLNFSHDDSELTPSYSIIASHNLATTEASYPANITFINQLPFLVNNSLVINQGQTVQLDDTMLSAVDPDNAQHNPDIVFTISGSPNGFFSTFSFTQSQLWAGIVYFTQDNTINPPEYRVNISRGGVTIGPAYPSIDFDTTPILQQNRFVICQRESKLVTPQMLNAVQPGNFSSQPLIFSIQNLQYSRFERTNTPGIATFNFTQAEVQNGGIRFIQDGSPNPPNFFFSITDNRITTPSYLAGVYFTYAPVLRTNTLTLNQGQSVVLNDNMLNAFNPNVGSEDLVFTISNAKQGNFIKANTTQNITQFNQSQLITNEIVFKADGSSVAPSYFVSVENRCSKTNPTAVFVNFNSAPVIVNNQLTITNGKPVILTATDLSANDRETPLVDLGFSISDVQHGYFDTITLPGTPITAFSQQMVFNGAIRFVPDNNIILPAYNVSVSDGILSTGPQAALLKLNTPSVTLNTFNTSNTPTNTGAIVGGVISAGVIGLAFFGFQWYLKRKTNQQFQKILLEGTSDADQAFNRDVVRPIANKIFSVINTTGCFGQRSEENTKAYMMAIAKIVSELRSKNANLDFNKMEPVDKESFINEIANQTRQQSVPKHKGVFGSCARYFKAEVTPQEIEHAAEAIAHNAVTWQNRHLSGVSAKTTNLGLELGKLSSIGFSDETANEDVPPGQEFKWMQNHMRAMGQQQHQDRKHFEERLAKQEAELASFRRQALSGSTS